MNSSRLTTALGMLFAFCQVALGQSSTTPPGTLIGTGFVVRSDGYMVTCDHLVAHAKGIEVYCNGSLKTAHLLQHDTAHDLALLQVDRVTDLTPLPIGNSNNVKADDLVSVAGFATTSVAGDSVAVNRGSISARDTYDVNLRFLMTVTVPTGVAGAPLLDAAGEVIGVVSAKSIVPGGPERPVGTPINYLKQLLRDQSVLPKQLPDGAPALSLDDLTTLAGKTTFLIKCTLDTPPPPVTTVPDPPKKDPDPPKVKTPEAPLPPPNAYEAPEFGVTVTLAFSYTSDLNIKKIQWYIDKHPVWPPKLEPLQIKVSHGSHVFGVLATGEGWTDSVGNSTEIGRAIARSVRLNCQKKLELNVISRTKERKGSRVQLIVEGTTNGGPAKLNEKPDL